MDVGSLLVCVCVFVASGGLLLAVSLFGAREKSYDEVLAERRALAAPSLTRPAKRPKKQGRKTKEKELSQNKLHVEFEEPGDEQPSQTNKKHVKREKVRSILVKKEEFEVLGNPAISVPANHFELIHPKDELELHAPHQERDISHKPKVEIESKVEFKTSQKEVSVKPTQSKTGPKPSIDAKKPDSKPSIRKEIETKPIEIKGPNKKERVDNKVVVPSTKENEEVEVKEVKNEEVIEEVSTSRLKDKKKKKGELNALQQLQSGGDTRHDVAVSLLIATVRKADLSRGEIQLLIDLLLNKQHETPTQSLADWTQGRADPVARLKKQLAEKERALTTEQETTSGLQARMRELRAELNSERSAHAHSQRALEEARQESQLRQRALAQQLRQREDLLRQQRSEDKHTVDLARAEVERYATAQAQVVEQLRQREQEVTQVAERLHQRDSEISCLKKDLARLETTQSHREEDVKLFEQQLMKLEPLEAQLCQRESEVKHLEQELTQIQTQLRQKDVEIVSLEHELKQLRQKDSELKRVQQEIVHLEARNTQLSQKDAEISRLETEITRLEGTLAEQIRVHQLNLQNEVSSVRAIVEMQLKESQKQLEQQSCKNDELRKKNWKAMEALSSAENKLLSMQKQSACKIDEEITRLKEDVRAEKNRLLCRLFPEITTGEEKEATECLAKLRSAVVSERTPVEVERLRAQLAHYCTAVADTEAMLARLEAHVKDEERNWRDELRCRDNEIVRLRRELDVRNNCTTGKLAQENGRPGAELDVTAKGSIYSQTHKHASNGTQETGGE